MKLYQKNWDFKCPKLPKIRISICLPGPTGLILNAEMSSKAGHGAIGGYLSFSLVWLQLTSS